MTRWPRSHCARLTDSTTCSHLGHTGRGIHPASSSDWNILSINGQLSWSVLDPSWCLPFRGVEEGLTGKHSVMCSERDDGLSWDAVGLLNSCSSRLWAGLQRCLSQQPCFCLNVKPIFKVCQKRNRKASFVRGWRYKATHHNMAALKCRKRYYKLEPKQASHVTAHCGETIKTSLA